MMQQTATCLLVFWLNFVGSLACASAQADTSLPLGKSRSRDGHGNFTGQVKLVVYVTDVRKSAEFYRDALGFRLLYFYDYVANQPVPAWDREEPAIYAEMAAGDQKFGLHLPQSEEDRRRLGGLKVYFRIRDLDAHRRRVIARSVDASEIVETPWMRWFSVDDADGNEIVFGETDPAVHTIDPW